MIHNFNIVYIRKNEILTNQSKLFVIQNIFYFTSFLMVFYKDIENTLIYSS